MSRNFCSTTCGGCDKYKIGMDDIVGELMTWNEYHNDIDDHRYNRPEYRPPKCAKAICKWCGHILLAWLGWDNTGGDWDDEKKCFDGDWYVKDLSFYATFNDEPMYENPNIAPGEWPGENYYLKRLEK